MTDEVDRWRGLASRLGIKVIAPAIIEAGNETASFVALLPQFGGKNGMIADPEWNAIEPHAASLIKLGYGYSAVSLGAETDDESAQEMLRDWGWSSEERKPPWW